VRRALAVVVALAVVGAASGCGGSGYDYVENREEGLFLKLRDDWSIVEVSAYELEKSGLDCCWGRFLEAPDRTVSPVASEDPSVSDVPVGLVHIITLDGEERDDANLNFLRRLTLNGQYDPLELSTMSERERSTIPPALAEIDILDYEELDGEGGTYGSDLFMRIGKEGPTARLVRQLAFISADFTTIYRLQVDCSLECYSINQDEIDAIFDSWTLDRTGD
jgi:hypothetical protein